MPATTLLHADWKACLADEVGATGATISTLGYDATGWRDAVVPGTVLTTLLADGDWLGEQLPPDLLERPENSGGFDPFYHLNNKYLPDIGDRALRGERFQKGRGRHFYTCWFRTEFRLDPTQRDDACVWLQLRGINYTATLFLNGHQLPGSPYSGMFRHRTFDITDLVARRGLNILAVKVEPLDHPGICNHANGSDGFIARDVSMQYLAGWDWVPAIPDRNTGIWDRVSLRTTGPVRLRHPQIITRVPGTRRPEGPQAPAFLTIAVDLVNTTHRAQSGCLSARTPSGEVRQEVRLAPCETRRLRFDPDIFPRLKLENPQLWWPNGYGPQNLHDLDLNFTTEEGAPSDADRIRFGIREIRSDNPSNAGRVFYVNGRRIFIRGGNWVGTDALLRLSSQRYRDEVRLHREMGLNMIRVWGGAIAERPEFYDACDEFGLLVMQDFWITGDGNGAWRDPTKRPREERRNYPDDHDLFLACARDTIRLLRNHPSLCFWCGGNEITPPPDIDEALARYIGDHPHSLDPNRVYVSASADAAYVDFDGDGLHGHGPYNYQEPEHYCTLARGFTTEIGTAALPTAGSMRAMIAPEDLFPDGRPGWRRPGWRYHEEQEPETYGAAIEQYGTARDLDDLCLKAQLVNYKSYQGIFEAWNARMWDTCTGLLIWKSQNCWPNLRSQIYDWFLDQTAGYFATRRACAPVSIQLAQDSWRVGVCNTTDDPLEQITATATFYDMDGIAHPSRERTATLPPDSFTSLFKLTRPRTLSTIHFLKLALRAASGELIADNRYWFSRRKPTTKTRYAGLEQLRKAGAQMKLITDLAISLQEAQYCLTATLHNPGPTVAFAVCLKLLRDDGRTRVLPTFYTDNYFILFPGDEKQIGITCARENAGDELPRLFVEGWNVAAGEIQ